MTTGWEVQMYNDIRRSREALERIANALDRAFPIEPVMTEES